MQQDGQPTVFADLRTLQKQLEEYHAIAKAKSAEGRKQGDQAAGGNVLIRGR